MHVAPPVRISLVPDNAWHWGVTVLVAFASGSMTAWLVSHGQAASVSMAVAALVVAGGSGAATWLCMSRHDARTCSLNWDGATWQWVQGATAPWVGEVDVMVDFGAWMLLRFAPAAPSRGAAWNAVSRSAAGPLWPAWRAALYSRRPGGDPHSTPGAI